MEKVTLLTMKRSILPLNFPKPIKLPLTPFSDGGLLQYLRYWYGTHGLRTGGFVFFF
jgi:hypothetical protein